MLVTTVERDNYLGRILTGRVYGGAVKLNEKIRSVGRLGGIKEEGMAVVIVAVVVVDSLTVSLSVCA
jgi:GTP-binding protein